MRSRVVVAAVSTGVVALAGLAITGSPASGTGGRTVELHAKEVVLDLVDVGEPGFGPGSHFVFDDEVFDGDRSVGEVGGTCTVVRVAEGAGATWNCEATLRLPRGQIALQGMMRADDAPVRQPFDLAVIGGTAAYEGVGGTLTYDDALSAPEHQLLLRLKHPRRR